MIDVSFVATFIFYMYLISTSHAQELEYVETVLLLLWSDCCANEPGSLGQHRLVSIKKRADPVPGELTDADEVESESWREVNIRDSEARDHGDVANFGDGQRVADFLA